MRLLPAALAALLCTTPAHAAEKKLSVCPQAKDFKEQIYNCGSNELAVKIAQQCSDTLMAASKAQGAAFAALLNGMKAQLGSAQNVSMRDSAQRLALAIQQFSAQIESMADQTDKVGNYTDAMIDFADGKDDDTSLECFSENFHKLQKIIDGLDHEIENSMDARDAALTMFNTLKAQGKKLDADPKFSLAAPGTKAPAAPAPKAGTKRPKYTGEDPYAPSDISGTEKIKR